MAGSIDVTKTAQAAQTVISDAIAAKVSSLNTEYGDDVTLVVPAEYRFAPVPQHDAYPGVTIIFPPQERDPELDAYGVYHQRGVIVLRTSNDTGTSAAQSPASLTPLEYQVFFSSRMMRAFYEILKDNRTLTISGTDNADTLDIEAIDLVGVEGDEGDEASLFELTTIMTVTVSISLN